MCRPTGQAAPSTGTPATGGPAAWSLHCHECGKSIEKELDELFRFISTDWPRCCQEVMTLYRIEPPARGRND